MQRGLNAEEFTDQWGAACEQAQLLGGETFVAVEQRGGTTTTYKVLQIRYEEDIAGAIVIEIEREGSRSEVTLIGEV